MKTTLVLGKILTLFAFIAINACNNTAEQKPETPEFDYYPLTNVYYDRLNNIFIYSLDSARTWNTYAPSSDKEPGTMGKKVVIQTNTGEVWKHNEEHRRDYGGTILNISSNGLLAENTGFAGTTERKAKKVKQIKPKGDKKEKKGVKEFFENLFKKKKDKSE